MTSQPALGQELWVEAASLVFLPAENMSSSQSFQDGLVFGEDKQGNINHLFYANNPTTAYETVAWYDGANFNYSMFGACVLLFPIDAYLAIRLHIQSLPNKDKAC